MVLILILIGGDYIICSLLVVLSCYASSTLDQYKTKILVPLVRYSVFMPKDSTSAQPVQYKESFQAFIIKAIIFGSGPRAVRYT